MEDIEDKSIAFLKQHIQIILTFIIFICYLSYYYYITLFNINFNIHKKCNKSHLYYFYTFIKDYKSQIKNSLICIIFFSLIFLFIIYYLFKKDIIKKKNLLIILSLITILIISIIIIHNLNELDSNDDINKIIQFYENYTNKNKVNSIYTNINKYYHIFNNLSKIDSNYYIFRFSKIYKKETLPSSIDDTYHQIILDSNDINEIKEKKSGDEIKFDNNDFKYFDLKSINNINNYITIDNINYIPVNDIDYYYYKINKDNINYIINLIKIYNDIINNIYKIDINNHIDIKDEELFKYINYNRKDPEQNIFNYTFFLNIIILTPEEWNTLGITDFTPINYITVDGKYFKSTDNLKWEQITDQNELTELTEYTNTDKKELLITLLKSKFILNDIILIPAEWNTLGITDFTPNNYITLDNKYFKSKSTDNLKWEQITDQNELTELTEYTNTDTDKKESLITLLKSKFILNNDEIIFTIDYDDIKQHIDNTFYDRNFLELFYGKKISFFYLSDLILISIIIIIFLLLYIDREKYLSFLTSYKFFIIIILIVIINKIYNY